MTRKIMPNDILMGEVTRLVTEGEKVTLLTKGNSMLPFIHGESDSVLLESPGELSEDMVVLAEVSQGSYVLHRILAIAGDKVVLMGDGNLKGKEVCRRSDVKAVAVKIIKPDREVDCMSTDHLFKVRIWKALLPVRRWILAVYRRLFI